MSHFTHQQQTPVHQPHPEKRADIDETPMTPAALGKLIAFIITVGTIAIGMVWFAAGIVQKQALTDAKIDALKTRVDDVAKIDNSNNEERKKDIAELKKASEDTNKSLADIATKVDRVVTIVERIDRRAGQP